MGRVETSLLRAHQFLRRGPVSEEGWSQLVAKGREGEASYRGRWQHDKIVRSTHGVNCTGSCSWQVYVKDGVITWETQAVDYSSVGPDMPEYEPRGCPRGASFSAWTVGLRRVSGYEEPRFEVVQHRLRIADQAPQRPSRTRLSTSRCRSERRWSRSSRWRSTSRAGRGGGPGRGRCAGAPRGAGGRRRRAVGERMLAIVSEPTGYPPDLLDVEADLGIDTVEVVEVFASIRDACNLGRDDVFKLASTPHRQDGAAHAG